MRIDEEIDDVTLVFTNKEKETLINALNILKAIDGIFDNKNISYPSLEEDILNIIIEIDKYTDYICK